MQLENPSEKFQNGFTMIEMMIVVGILAAVAGAIIYSQGETRDTAYLGIATTEMASIKSALGRYRNDIGRYPVTTSPADFSGLFQQGTDPDWNIAVARGWRGPYLSRSGEGYVDIGDGLSLNGLGSPANTGPGAIAPVPSIADPFIYRPARRNTAYTACGVSDTDAECLLDWRSLPGQEPRSQFGRPYLLFDLDDSQKARVISMGPNGQYESQSCAGLVCSSCAPGGDDLVLCLAY